MLPTHILKVPLATNPKRLLLVEPPTDLSLLPDELQTVLMGLMMAKEKAQTQSGGEAVTPSAEDTAQYLSIATQVTRLCVIGAIDEDGSNQVLFKLADLHQSVGDLRPLAAIPLVTRVMVMGEVIKYLNSFRCEI